MQRFPSLAHPGWSDKLGCHCARQGGAHLLTEHFPLKVNCFLNAEKLASEREMNQNLILLLLSKPWYCSQCTEKIPSEQDSLQLEDLKVLSEAELTMAQFQQEKGDNFNCALTVSCGKQETKV